MLCRLLPKRVAWTSKDLWNVRLLAKRYRNSILCQDAFNKDVVPEIPRILATHGQNALDNNVDDILDPSLCYSQELFEETLRETLDNGHARFLVGLFFKKLRAADPGFKYEVFYAEDGAATGYVYQTSDMRRNFEKYGNFISLDMMKRQQNDLRWSYFRPVVVDCNNTV